MSRVMVLAGLAVACQSGAAESGADADTAEVADSGACTEEGSVLAEKPGAFLAYTAEDAMCESPELRLRWVDVVTLRGIGGFIGWCEPLNYKDLPGYYAASTLVIGDASDGRVDARRALSDAPANSDALAPGAGVVEGALEEAGEVLAFQTIRFGDFDIETATGVVVVDSKTLETQATVTASDSRSGLTAAFGGSWLAIGRGGASAGEGVVLVFAEPLVGDLDEGSAVAVHPGRDANLYDNYAIEPVGDTDGDGLTDMVYTRSSVSWLASGADLLIDGGLDQAARVDWEGREAAKRLGDVDGDGLGDYSIGVRGGREAAIFYAGSTTPDARVYGTLQSDPGSDRLVIYEFSVQPGSGLASVVMTGGGDYKDWRVVELPSCGVVDAIEQGISLSDVIPGGGVPSHTTRSDHLVTPGAAILLDGRLVSW